MFSSRPIKDNFRKEGGFTLIELLVVIVIIAILSGIVFVNPDNWQKGLALERSAQKLSQDISQSRALAMKGESGACVSGSLNGYGIYLDKIEPPKYFIYMNCNADKSYNSGSDKKIKIDIPLEKNIIVCGLKGSGSEVSALSIFFEPPDPAVFINNVPSATSSVTVCIKNDASKQKTIEINKVGNINLK